MARIEIQDGDEWVVILKDGERIYTGHGPSLHEWSNILGELGEHEVIHRLGMFGELDEDGYPINDGDDTIFTPEW